MTDEQKSINLKNAIAEAEQQIRDGLIQGCVFGTLEHAPVAVGLQNVHPGPVPMTVDSRFDIASVGKVFTGACFAYLASQGKVDPDAPFTEYLPDHVLGKNCRITVRDLATHSAGFDNGKPYAKDNWSEFYDALMHKMPVRKIGEAFEYSCYDLILIGVILNKVTGKDLDTLAREIVWKPLGMDHTTWNEPGPGPHEVEHWFPNRPAGIHNDDVCKRINIPIGSGSCFSTCGDMLKFAKDMAEQTHFSRYYYDLLTTCTYEGPGFDIGTREDARRAFVWDMCDMRRPWTFSKNAIFHSGWTGQTIAVDPKNGRAAVIMTSRTGDWELANQARVKLVDILYQ